MRNIVITILLALAASVNLFAQHSGTCGPNVIWTLQNNVLTISGSGAMTDYVRLDSVPWYIYRDSIFTVVINSGVTTIGDFAFENYSVITSVIIPDGITRIGLCAFSFCSNLVSINIPGSVTSIGDGAFGACQSMN